MKATLADAQRLVQEIDRLYLGNGDLPGMEWTRTGDRHPPEVGWWPADVSSPFDPLRLMFWNGRQWMGAAPVDKLDEFTLGDAIESARYYSASNPDEVFWGTRWWLAP